MKIDKQIKYSEYIAENIPDDMTYSEYLDKYLDKREDLSKYCDPIEHHYRKEKIEELLK